MRLHRSCLVLLWGLNLNVWTSRVTDPMPLQTRFRAVALAVAVAHAVSAPLYQIPTAVCYPSSSAPLSLGAHAFGSLTLTVAPGTWSVDGQVVFNTRAYYYQGVQMIPGPTIRMKAGTECQVTLVNALSTAGQPYCNQQMASEVPGTRGNFHCPDVTNLHTHGECGAGAGHFRGVSDL